MGEKKYKNKLSNLADELGEIEDKVNSGRYDSLEDFREAYKDGEIAEQKLTTVFHADNEIGHLSVFGDAGIPYDEIVKFGGIDNFIEALKDVKREKKEKSKGD